MSESAKKTRKTYIPSTPLLIIGSGRSGTTLVLRLLNTQDSILLHGEHGIFLRQIAESYFSFETKTILPHFNNELECMPNKKKFAEVMKYGDINTSWGNSFGLAQIDKKYSQFIKSFFQIDKNIPYWGFKEIRYGFEDTVLELFLRLFPNTKIIFVVRNPLNVIKSQKIHFSEGSSLKLAKQWVRDNEKFWEFAKKNPNNSYILPFESLIDNKQKAIQEISAFLGTKLNSKKMEAVFKRKFGSHTVLKKAISIPNEIIHTLKPTAKKFGYKL